MKFQIITSTLLLTLRFILFIFLFLVFYTGLGVANILTFGCTTIFSLVVWFFLIPAMIFLATLYSINPASKYAPTQLALLKSSFIKVCLVSAVVLEASAFIAGDYRVSSISPSGDPLRGTHIMEATTAIWCYLLAGRTKQSE